jgi:hypothetical protein
MAPWYGFFAAQVASTAALAGLLFVAISVNITRILQYAWLPARAGQTLVVLMGALAISSLLLFPAAEGRFVSSAILGVSALTYLITCRFSDVFANFPPEWRARPDYRRAVGVNLVGSQLATLPTLVGSILTVMGHASGYDWLACGVILALAFGLLNSWVLLVEILR